jgi:uncharacterized protein (TIGR01244 family)
MRRSLFAVVFAAFLPLTCASALASGQPSQIEGFDGLYRSGDLLLGSQPSEDELKRLIDAFEIVRVVNLAHPRFMERNVSFDEAALLEESGVGYVHLSYPMQEGMHPGRVKELSEAISDAGGVVFLHSAWMGDTAAHWTAMQVIEGELQPAEGFHVYRALSGEMLHLPFEGYAGGRLMATGVSDGEFVQWAAQDAGDLSGPLAEAPVGLPTNVEDPEGIRGGMVVDGRFAYAGQPDEAALERFADEGYLLIFNLRRHEEMEGVEFDEAAVCKRLGMRYVHTPSGWSNAEYTPDQLSAFAEAIEQQPGRVLIHCQVGWRARHFWGAYLHRYRGLSVEDALWVSHSPDDSWPLTQYERLIGQTLQYDLAHD